MRRHQRGFTLIEVLMALAVFALIAALGATLLDGSIRQRDQLKQLNRQYQQLERSWLLLQHDLQQLIWRRQRDPYGTLNNAYLKPEVVDNAFVVSWLTRAHSSWQNDSWQGQIQQVSWRVQAGQLQRRTSAVLDSAESGQRDFATVLEGVSALRWEFWLEGRWIDRLPDGPVFPQAARLHLTLERVPGELVRVFLLPQALP